ncbi:hypothetical protein BGZ70_003472 [Mortierella alpina]|uniref:Uncharacterized protein n=1 Tax=Mortierella alpina TaxID=64518 RepID=A0A9P6LVT5_MORAP|nr:hypothetical protein BGZ70_003472 [Mortierella alpina]
MERAGKEGFQPYARQARRPDPAPAVREQKKGLQINPKVIDFVKKYLTSLGITPQFDAEVDREVNTTTGDFKVLPEADQDWEKTLEQSKGLEQPKNLEKLKSLEQPRGLEQTKDNDHVSFGSLPLVSADIPAAPAVIGSAVTAAGAASGKYCGYLSRVRNDEKKTCLQRATYWELNGAILPLLGNATSAAATTTASPAVSSQQQQQQQQQQQDTTDMEVDGQPQQQHQYQPQYQPGWFVLGASTAISGSFGASGMSDDESTWSFACHSHWRDFV